MGDHAEVQTRARVAADGTIVVSASDLTAAWSEALSTNDHGLAGIPLALVKALGIRIVKDKA